MKWPFPIPTKREIITVALAVMLFLIVLVSSALWPLAKNVNWGFGPGWDCIKGDRGDPTCIKKPTPRQDQAIPTSR
jgi:hypothetical protein